MGGAEPPQMQSRECRNKEAAEGVRGPPLSTSRPRLPSALGPSVIHSVGQTAAWPGLPRDDGQRGKLFERQTERVVLCGHNVQGGRRRAVLAGSRGAFLRWEYSCSRNGHACPREGRSLTLRPPPRLSSAFFQGSAGLLADSGRQEPPSVRCFLAPPLPTPQPPPGLRRPGIKESRRASPLWTAV